MDTGASRTWAARYVFRVRFRIDPSLSEVTVDPAEFETTLYRTADPPGEAGWLFFRDHLWRGNISEETYFREMTEEVLGVPVMSISFSEFQTDQAYFGSLQEAIGGQLDEFRADTVNKAIKKYLGSSIRVVDSDDRYGR